MKLCDTNIFIEAATAISHDIELYTLNIKDFIFIPPLKLYQPK
jgi:predicted nucleic acid-binding protein